MQPIDAGIGEREHRVQRVFPIGGCLGRPLDLDVPSVVDAHDVHVDLGRRVFLVVEVEHRAPIDDPDRNRSQHPREHRRAHDLGLAQLRERQRQRDVGARDARGARAAVGGEDVAVDPERARAQGGAIDDASERAADQPLDLHRAPRRPPLRNLARGPLAARGGEHRVLPRHPTFPPVLEMRRDAILDRHRAQNPRVPHLDQRRAQRVAQPVRGDQRWAQCVVGASVVAWHRHSVAFLGTASVRSAGSGRLRLR
jgi:hypothetical protein